MGVAESESRRGAVRIKRFWLNLNPAKTNQLLPNLNLEKRLLGLNGRGQI